MAEIKFKATKRKHSSGYATLEKSGDLIFDQDDNAKDGIWLMPKTGERIFIDCDFKTKQFRIVFEPKFFKKSLIF